ncbi:MAG: hypothetical protein JWN00_3376, partial [Actinomycetia bacterium]|nr:hypothetical protein [Actinomycetes bacterium]
MQVSTRAATDLFSARPGPRGFLPELHPAGPVRPQGARQALPGLPADRRAKVDAYAALVDEQRQALDAILTLTREIAPWTIEKV